MTEEQQELSSAVAGAIGWKSDDSWGDYPPFATDDAAAMLIAERLRQAGWLVQIKLMPDGEPFLCGDDWTRDPQLHARAVISLTWDEFLATEADARKRIIHSPLTYGEDWRECLCRAALKAMEEKP